MPGPNKKKKSSSKSKATKNTTEDAATKAKAKAKAPRFFPIHADFSINPPKLQKWKPELTGGIHGPIAAAFVKHISMSLRLMLLRDGKDRDDCIARLPASAQWLWSIIHVITHFENSKGAKAR